MTRTQIYLEPWLDRNLHIHSGKVMDVALTCAIKQKADGAVFTSNIIREDGTIMHIDDIGKINDYAREVVDGITRSEKKLGVYDPTDSGHQFEFYSTSSITDQSDINTTYEIGTEHSRAIRLYVNDTDTPSTYSVRKINSVFRILEMMGRNDITLILNLETGSCSSNRDDDVEYHFFKDQLIPVLNQLPNLTVVFDNLTDGNVAKEFIAENRHPGGLYATVAADFLFGNDLVAPDGKFITKYPFKWYSKRDYFRWEIRKLVTSGNRNFGAGTNSTPLRVPSIHTTLGGNFTSPIATEMYTSVFDYYDGLDHLNDFLSTNFIKAYRKYHRRNAVMKLYRTPFVVPTEIDGFKVFRGGTKLPWSLSID